MHQTGMCVVPGSVARTHGRKRTVHQHQEMQRLSAYEVPGGSTSRATNCRCCTSGIALKKYVRFLA